MHLSVKGIVVGTLALVGATIAVAEDAQAMPIQALAPIASAAPLEHVYYDGYGYRRPLVRRFARPFVRPFYGYRRYGYGYGYRRPLLGYRRPFYGYGYRRF